MILLFLFLRGKRSIIVLLKIKLDLFQVKFQKNQKSKEFCDNCLNAFSNKKTLESHEEYGFQKL